MIKKERRLFVEELDGMDCDPRDAQLLGVDVLLRAVHPEIREAYFRFLERMGCDYEWWMP